MFKKTLKKPMGIKQRTDNTVAKRKLKMICKTLQRKLKCDQHEPHMGAQEE